jgi:O-methyltransferase involved in polyketide biosynthesis
MNNIKLEGVAETLLLPLWGRAVDNEKEKSILHDEFASKIVKALNYDFAQISKHVNKLSMASWIARSVYFDEQIKNYICNHNDVAIINIGCGFDTTFERIDNGKIKWVDIDFPEVIDIRRKYIKESSRRVFIAKSVFEIDWGKDIGKNENVLILMAGVIYYFSEEQIKGLIKTIQMSLGHFDIVFDYSSKRGIEVANKKVIKNGGMDQKAVLVWGIDNINDVEKWELGIRIIDNQKMFREHKMKYPWHKRIGMNIADKMNIMSLAHLQIRND